VLISAELLSHWQPTIIKGNAAEIGAMAESTEVCLTHRDIDARLIYQVLSRGVDSVGSGFADPGRIVKALARKRGTSPLLLFAVAWSALTGSCNSRFDGSERLHLGRQRRTQSFKWS